VGSRLASAGAVAHCCSHCLLVAAIAVQYRLLKLVEMVELACAVPGRARQAAVGFKRTSGISSRCCFVTIQVVFDLLNIVQVRVAAAM
jgi:hypothetical protein